MIHPAIKTGVYKTARQYLKDGVSFVLINTMGDRKEFIPGRVNYNLTYLSNHFKFEFNVDQPVISVEEL